MTASYVLGLDCKLYYLTTGTRATWSATTTNGWKVGPAPANLTEIQNVKDVNFGGSTKEADVSTRNNNGFTATVPTLKDASLDFEMVYAPSDAAFAAIQSAWLARSPIALAALFGDKATVGTEGLWADFCVTQFQASQPLEGASTVKVTVKPTFSAVAAEMVRVAAA